MSVFNNLYTKAYENLVQQQEADDKATKFEFFDVYFTSLISTFRWKGLKPYIPFFEIERFFQSAGIVAMNEDKEIYPIFPSGSLLPNGEFSDYTMLYMDGTSKQYKKDDIVIGYNNSSKMPYIYMVKFFSDKTAKALEAVNCALDRAMLPVVVNCADEAELKKWGELKASNQYEKFIASLKGKMVSKDTQILNPFDNTKNDIIALWDVYVRYRNLYYSTIGINNVEIQKRERLTEAEGAGNDEIVRYSIFNDMKMCRDDFVEKCNAKFDAGISFEINRDTTSVFQLSLDNADKIEQAEIEITKGANIPTNTQEEDKQEDEINEDTGK